MRVARGSVTLLPRSKRLLISWLQSPSAVILEPQKIKSDTVSTVSPSISHEVMGLDLNTAKGYSNENCVTGKEEHCMDFQAVV